MTDGNPHPDEEPIPPTSTEWSEARGGDDDELAPPFTPGAPEPEPASPEPAPPRPGSPDVSDPDFPVHAFDIQGGEGEGGAEAGAGYAGAPPADPELPSWAVPEPETAAPATEPIARISAASDLADRLESMARTLREGGPEAVESEMKSPDRFTALLAGLLAGYLTDRD